MPGSVPSMAVQKKQSVIPPSLGPLSARTIDSQRKVNGSKTTGEKSNISNINSKTKKNVCPSPVNKTAPISNTASPRTNTAGANGLNVDERLRLARERREEHDKLLASRELSWLEREQRARRYHEQQLEARKKRLLEQRLKEERRRAAVEEKRNRRLKEEKERHESAVRRTLERSQRAQQSLTQSSRGRRLTKNSVSCHSMNTTTTTTPKPQHHSGPAQRRTSASPSPGNSSHRSVNLAQIKVGRQKDVTKKNPNTNTGSNTGSNTRSNTASNNGPNTRSNTRSAPVNARVKPVTNSPSRTPSPSPVRTPRRPIRTQSAPRQLELPSVPEEDLPVCSAALSPGNSRPARTSAEGPQEEVEEETPRPDSAVAQTDAVARTDRSSSQTPPPTAPRPPEATNRPSAGTKDPEEASRLLAEKRREARLQREREEQERQQREEEERRSREELEKRRAEERARLQAEAQRLVEEKRRKDEEDQRRADEERAQAMREAALLQKQREEELAREREKAEQMKREREILVQKEEAERQARKKRLEEIMRRTRRTDPADTKSAPVRILPSEAKPKENTQPVQNGTIEEAVKVPVGTKPSQLGLNGVEDMVPVVAFKERRSLRALSGLEEIQTHQRAEVI
ncbi:uncharacterized protein map7a [Polymixia lowei]